MERTLIIDCLQKIEEKVLLKGWVNGRRDHGKLIFFDLRDRSGLVQVVVNSKNAKETYNQAGILRDEFVVAIEGQVKQRSENLINKNSETGTIEIEANKIEIISKAETPLFNITSDGREIEENTRLQYRYLDLRRPRLQKNVRRRHKVIKFIRDYLDERSFVEIETPILTKATPEGARDFLVPSRIYAGKFYALPQSPQQYKQLLMVAGFERYYQIARCFRDEDPRADRAYGEFTQLDLEISFPTQEEILSLIEGLYKNIVSKFYPEKHLTFESFPRLSYDEVMKKYGIDKPDLRKDKNDASELAFAFVMDFPLFEWKEREKRWDATHHPFTAPKEEAVPLLDKYEKTPEKYGELKSYQHDIVLNGHEVAGGSIRITNPEVQRRIFQIMGHTDEQIEKKFGHLLKAFKYGVPPHGGIASGIDRLLMVLENEASLREVIAFPTTAVGKTSVMEAPMEVEPEQLKELHIKTTI